MRSGIGRRAGELPRQGIGCRNRLLKRPPAPRLVTRPGVARGNGQAPAAVYTCSQGNPSNRQPLFALRWWCSSSSPSKPCSTL